jgi:hypothetical protein
MRQLPNLKIGFTALLISAGLISCGLSRKIATRWMDGHPDTVAVRCALDFPCVPGEIISRDTVRKTDTTYIPGNSISCPTTDSGSPVYVHCPPQFTIRDSTTVHDTAWVLDSARIRILTAQRDSVNRALVNVSADRDRLKMGRNTWRSIAIPLIAALLAWAAAKFKLI